MKKVISIDIDSCIGCQACAAACIDHNDIDTSNTDLWRGVYRLRHSGDVSIYLSLTCMHCMNAPCVVGCPTGAITMDKQTGYILVNDSVCIGCFSCSLACPFGIPGFDADDKMHKCDMCKDLTEKGHMPACVSVCPTNALKYGLVNEIGFERAYGISEKTIDGKKTRWP